MSRKYKLMIEREPGDGWGYGIEYDTYEDLDIAEFVKNKLLNERKVINAWIEKE